MTDNSKNRRKTLVINPKQQTRLVMTMSLVPALGMAATMGLVCFFCHNLFHEAMVLDVQLDSLVPLFLAVSGFVLVSGFFLISNSLVISHRIAGPSYRICKTLEQIRQGDLAFQVRFRQGDYLLDVRDELNLLLDELNRNPPAGYRTREMKEAEDARAEATQKGGAEVAPELDVVESETERVLAGAGQSDRE